MSQGRDKKLHRQTVRMPEELYSELVKIAEQDQRTVSDWIVVTVDRVVRETEPVTTHPKKSWERFRPWHTDKRLTVRMSTSTADAVRKIAGTDSKSISLWIARAVQHAIEARGVTIQWRRGNLSSSPG